MLSPIPRRFSFKTQLLLYQRPPRFRKEFSAPTLPTNIASEPTKYDAIEPVSAPSAATDPRHPQTSRPRRVLVIP